MNAIEPGMWVECVRCDNTPSNIGRVFRVEEVLPSNGCSCGDHHGGGLILAGYRRPYNGHGWAACCFRPIYRPRADLIDSLLAPVPENITIRALNPDLWPAVPEGLEN